MISANSTRTSGFDQSRSHCQALNVVHTHLLELLVPGEVARREVREHLGEGPLVGVGLGPVGVDVEVVLVVLLPRPRPDRPVVLARDVVEDQVEDEAHPVLAQRGRQVAEVVDRPQVGTDRAVVPHRIPAVVVPHPRLEQRHEVEVAHAQLAEVRDLVLDALEVVGEPLGVGGVAHHAGQLEPVRLQRTPDVEDVQVVRTLDERLMSQADQTVCERERRVVPVQRLQRLDEVAAPSLDAKLEELLAVGADGHARIQPHRHRCVEGGGTGVRLSRGRQRPPRRLHRSAAARARGRLWLRLVRGEQLVGGVRHGEVAWRSPTRPSTRTRVPGSIPSIRRRP